MLVNGLELIPIPQSKDSERRLRIRYDNYTRRISQYKQGLIEYLIYRCSCYNPKFQYFLKVVDLDKLERWVRILKESVGINGLYHCVQQIKKYIKRKNKGYLFALNMLKIE